MGCSPSKSDIGVQKDDLQPQMDGVNTDVYSEAREASVSEAMVKAVLRNEDGVGSEEEEEEEQGAGGGGGAEQQKCSPIQVINTWELMAGLEGLDTDGKLSHPSATDHMRRRRSKSNAPSHRRRSTTRRKKAEMAEASLHDSCSSSLSTLTRTRKSLQSLLSELSSDSEVCSINNVKTKDTGPFRRGNPSAIADLAILGRVAVSHPCPHPRHSRSISEPGPFEASKAICLRCKETARSWINSEITTVPESKERVKSFQWKCPPNGEEKVVLYTTSLRGIRKTFESCNTVREILEGFGVVVDERDVSMDAGYLKEMRELVGKEQAVPRLFVRGRYIGGGTEVFQLHEEGKLWCLLEGVPRGQHEMMQRREWGGGSACEICRSVRFIPCTLCNGSCKLVGRDGEVNRCITCNENGLIRCPLCQ